MDFLKRNLECLDKLPQPALSCPVQSLQHKCILYVYMYIQVDMLHIDLSLFLKATPCYTLLANLQALPKYTGNAAINAVHMYNVHVHVDCIL